MDTSYLQSRLKEDWGAFYTLLSNVRALSENPALGLAFTQALI